MRRDDGQLTVLITGLTTFALALALVLVGATGLHLERKRLLAATDLAVLDAADADFPAGYFAGTAAGSGRLVLTDASVRAGVEAYFAAHPDPALAHVSVTQAHASADGTVQVTVAAVVHPPLLTRLLGDLTPGVRVAVSSEARAG